MEVINTNKALLLNQIIIYSDSNQKSYISYNEINIQKIINLWNPGKRKLINQLYYEKTKREMYWKTKLSKALFTSKNVRINSLIEKF